MEHGHFLLPALVAALYPLELDQRLAHSMISTSLLLAGLPWPRVTFSCSLRPLTTSILMSSFMPVLMRRVSF